MANAEHDHEQPFIAHLIELRTRLLWIVGCVLLLAIGFSFFANTLYSYLAEPLLHYLPKDSSMIATDVASPFFTPFKLVLVTAIFVSVPMILYQFWAFVAPGLYQHERRLIFPLLLASTTLFYLGAIFAYYVVFPLMFQFLTTSAPVGVTMMTDIAKYLDFVLALFFAFGVAFQVPVLTVVLVWTGLATRESLADMRPYVIVGIFVVAMFLTPPDAISQTLLAVPMCLLFELGLLFSRFWVRDSDEIETDSKQLEQRFDEFEQEDDRNNQA
jgi:sec-independent protein translocase protein TatC